MASIKEPGFNAKNSKEARGEETPQLSEFKIIMQRLNQVTLEKRALEAVVGTVQKEVQEAKAPKVKESYVQTW